MLSARRCFELQVYCKIAWICVLEKEFFAAIQVLDEIYGIGHELRLVQSRNDRNVYCMGRIGPHDIIINCPSGSTGQLRASRIVTDMEKTFPSVRFAMVVGIGGGAPHLAIGHDVRLGDVVVGNKIIMYRSGKRTDKRFIINRPSEAAPESFMSLMTNLTFDLMNGPALQSLVEEAASNGSNRQIDYSRPKVDHLFKSDMLHDSQHCECLHQQPLGDKLDSKLVSRGSRAQRDLVKIHKGIIGSADQVLRNAQDRDALAVEESILCVEMEAGGVLMHKKAVIIKGISDYADGHKNDTWHDYASLSAAVCAKELLRRVSAGGVEAEERVFGVGDLLGFAQNIINGARERQRDGLRQGNESGSMGDSIDMVQILCAYFGKITLEQQEQQEQTSRHDAAMNSELTATKLAELTKAQEEMRQFISKLREDVEVRVQEAPPVTRQEWEELKAKVDNTAEDVEQLQKLTEMLGEAADIANKLGEVTGNQAMRDGSRKFIDVVGVARALSSLLGRMGDSFGYRSRSSTSRPRPARESPAVARRGARRQPRSMSRPVRPEASHGGGRAPQSPPEPPRLPARPGPGDDWSTGLRKLSPPALPPRYRPPVNPSPPDTPPSGTPPSGVLPERRPPAIRPKPAFLRSYRAPLPS